MKPLHIVWCLLSMMAHVAVNTCAYVPLPYELKNLLQDVDVHDARVFINLLFYSYQRSAVTLATQDAGYAALCELHDQWQGCVERRLNPSQGIGDYSYSNAQHKFATLRRTFHDIHTYYAYIVQAATSATLQNDTLIRHINAMRNRSRSLVIARMYTILDEIRAALTALHSDTYGYTDSSSHKRAMPTDNQHTIEETISSIVNTFAATSFVELNTTLMTTGSFFSNQYQQSQHYSNLLWNTIETARAEFYKTYFIRTIQVLNELAFPPETFLSIVSHEGATETPSSDNLSLVTLFNDGTF